MWNSIHGQNKRDRGSISKCLFKNSDEMTVVGYVHAQYLKVTLLILYVNEWDLDS